MYDTKLRIEMVKCRVNVLHRKHENGLSRVLSILCLVLACSLVGSIGTFGSFRQGRVVALYGATMLFEDAGGYVLVGVLAFIAAVVITVLCIRYQEKGKINEKRMEDEW